MAKKKITLKNNNGDELYPLTVVQQVEGLKAALDGKLGKTEKAVSAKATKVSKASEADPNFALSFYAGQTQPSTTPTADKVYVGSSADGSIISVPALDGSTSLANYMNLRMSFNSNFFHEIAVLPQSSGIYHRNVQSKTAFEWKQLLEGLVTTSHIADAAITPAKIQTSIALNGTPSMTVEPTTSSPDKTIASVGLVKEAVDGIEIGGTNHLRYLKDDGSSYWDGGSGVTCDVTIDGDVIKGQTNGNNNPRIYNSSTKEIVWEPNTDYVLSYYAKGQGDYSALIIIEGNNVNFCPFSDMGVYSSEWKKYVKKFTTPSDIIDANTQLLKFYCGHRNANDTTSWLEIKDIKIERGNKATDWSPAPEDVQKQLNDTVNDKLEGYASIQYVNNKVASIGTPGNATETGAGIVRAATQVEVAAGHVSDNDPAEMAFVRPETLQSKLSNYPTTTAMTQAINESRQIIYYQSSQPSGGKNGDIWIKP